MEGVGSVLVIDDEPVLQDVLGTLLLGAGFDYHGATTAADGLQQLRDEEIDVVLLDLMLPDRPGLELLPDIKTHDPHLPVVVITAYSSVESAIEAMRLGAFHYVPKPFKNEEVLHLVRRAPSAAGCWSRICCSAAGSKAWVRSSAPVAGCRRSSSSSAGPLRRDPTS